MKCEKCEKNFEEDETYEFEFCKDCLNKVTKICCCSKEFMAEPKSITIVIPTKNGHLYKEYDTIPEYFFEKLAEHLYHILACRGCKLGEISVQDNFTEALSASIHSCVYQKLTINEITEYVYLSDSIDPTFEEYLHKNGIKVGEAMDIKLTE